MRIDRVLMIAGVAVVLAVMPAHADTCDNAIAASKQAAFESKTIMISLDLRLDALIEEAQDANQIYDAATHQIADESYDLWDGTRKMMVAAYQYRQILGKLAGIMRERGAVWEDRMAILTAVADACS